MTDQHLSPAETARRLGVSPKALRLYEQHGLVTPLRTRTGWRTYGPAEFAALHQVLALKRLGLPLARIAELLKQRKIALSAILGAQEDALSREIDRGRHALDLVRRARAMLAAGQTLSVDDLITLTKETTMTTKEQHEEMQKIFDPIVEKHFSPEDRNALEKRAFDQQEVSRAWDGLMAEAKTLMAKGDTTSPAAMDLARAACIRAFLCDPLLVLIESPLEGQSEGLAAPLVNAALAACNHGAAALWLTPGDAVWADRSAPVARLRLSEQGLSQVRRIA